MKAIGILLLAGESKRTGTAIKKQYVPSKSGIPLFLATYKKLRNAKICDSFLFVVPKGDLEKVKEMLQERRIEENIRLIEGGENREQSVFFALKEIENTFAIPPSMVLIHDADRPYLEESFLKRTQEKMGEETPFLPLLPSFDSLLLKEEKGAQYLAREKVYRVQTPQAYPFEKLMAAFKEREKDLGLYRDEGSLYLSVYDNGLESIEGSEKNIKITTAEELDYWRNSDE